MGIWAYTIYNKRRIPAPFELGSRAMRIQHVLSIIIGAASLAFASPVAAQMAETCCETQATALAFPELANFSIGNIRAEDPQPAGHQPEAAPVSEASGNAVALEGSVTVADGRIFQDQRLDFSSDPVTELSVNATYRGWTLGIWHAESLIGKKSDRETDFTLSRTILEASGFSVSGQIGVYIIPGLDPVYEAKVTVAHRVGARCEAALSAEIMRDGFVDEVLRGQLSCSREVAPRLTIDATPSISLSNFGGGVSFGGEAGISYQLSDDLALRAFYQGYTSGIGSGHRGVVTFSFSL